MEVIHNIRVDFGREELPAHLSFMQNDSARKIQASLYENSKEWSVPKSTSLYVAYTNAKGENKKITSLPNGDPIATYSGNVVTVSIHPAVTESVGNIPLVVVFVDKSGNQITSFPVAISVVKNPADKSTGAEALSPKEFDQLMASLALERSRIDNIVSMKDGSVTIQEFTDDHISGVIATNGASAYINFTISGLSIKAGGEHYTGFCIPAELASLCRVQLESSNENLNIFVNSSSEANNGKSRILIKNIGSSAYTADMETTSRGVYPLKSVFIPELADIRVDSNGDIYENAGSAVRTNMQNRPQYSGKPKSSDYNGLTANLPQGFYIVHKNDWDDLPDNPADRSEDPMFALLIFRYSPNYNIQVLYATEANFQAYRIVNNTTGEVYKDWWSVADTRWIDLWKTAENYDNKISNLTEDGSYRIKPEEWTDHPFAEDSLLLVFRYTLNYVVQICITLETGSFATRIVHLTDKTVWRDWKGINSQYEQLKILAVGDSITYGWRNDYKGYLGYLGLPYHNESVSGSTISKRVTDRKNIPDQLLEAPEYDPDVIIAEGGINDYIFNAPMGEIPTSIVKTDSAADELDRSNVMGALQFLFYKMIKLHPKAQRFFMLVHKVIGAPDRNPGESPDFSNGKQDYTKTKNKAGYTQTELFDAIKSVCVLYNVKIIDVFNKSPIDTAFSEYVSPISYSDDNSVTYTEFVDFDGLHPLDYGYRYGYVPVVKQALVGGGDSAASGQKGDRGEDGKDGLSPSIKVDEKSNGYKITVADAGGTQTFFVPNGDDGQPGADGYTPQKGVDYYTETDKTEMVNAVIAALPVYNGEVEDV